MIALGSVFHQNGPLVIVQNLTLFILIMMHKIPHKISTILSSVDCDYSAQDQHYIEFCRLWWFLYMTTLFSMYTTCVTDKKIDLERMWLEKYPRYTCLILLSSVWKEIRMVVWKHWICWQKLQHCLWQCSLENPEMMIPIMDAHLCHFI